MEASRLNNELHRSPSLDDEHNLDSQGYRESRLGDKMDMMLTEDDSKPAVFGILKLEIFDVRKLFIEDLMVSDNLYVKMTVRTLCKRTKVVLNQYGNPRWDQTKHFPVTVVRNRRHPFNLIRIQVYRFGPMSLEHKEIGSVAFHLHDVIKQSPIDGCFDLFDSYQTVGEIHLGLTFTYGMFGYGYSSQLKEDSLAPEHFLRHSLFPRIDPPPERQDLYRATLIPKAVKHPSYIPFNQKVILGYGEDIANVLDMAPEDSERFTELQSSMKRIEDLKEKYYSLPTRMDRLSFLHKTILSGNGKMETIKDKVDSSEDQYAPKKYIKYVKPVVGIQTNPTNDELMGRGRSGSTRKVFFRDPTGITSTTNQPLNSPNNNNNNNNNNTSTGNLNDANGSTYNFGVSGSPVLTFMEKMRRDNIAP